jgi:hypothetical protein
MALLSQSRHFRWSLLASRAKETAKPRGSSISALSLFSGALDIPEKRAFLAPLGPGKPHAQNSVALSFP